MHTHEVPETLWDFGLKHATRIRSMVARDSLEGRTPMEMLTGTTPDISEIMDFAFYDWVKYYDPVGFPSKREFLGRWLGPATHVGQALCYYIIKQNGQIISRSTVRPLTEDELISPDELQARSEFTRQLTSMIGDFDDTRIFEMPADDIAQPLALDDPSDMPIPADPPEVTPDDHIGIDPLIHASIILPRGDRAELGRVIDSKRNRDGLYIGRKHKMPTLDSRVYVVEFPDGDQMDVSYNTIAEHFLFTSGFRRKSISDFQRNYRSLSRQGSSRQVRSIYLPQRKALQKAYNGRMGIGSGMEGWILLLAESKRTQEFQRRRCSPIRGQQSH
mmetsp:Transcript_18822/g.26691  ORF Transcript_18822/g.26691 Transcript_18822/m.26691 type:complete len:331 (+) Transcript_18822:1723-2715(+)